MSFGVFPHIITRNNPIIQCLLHWVFVLQLSSESYFLICIIALPGKNPVLKSVLSKEFAINKFCFQRKQQSIEIFHLFPLCLSFHPIDTKLSEY